MIKVTMSRPSVGLGTMPVEAKIEIFTSLPDLWNVNSLCLTSRCFHHAFREGENQVVRTIISRQIDGRYVREILAVAKSSLITPVSWSKQGVEQILSDYFNAGPDATSVQWTMSSGRNIEILSRVLIPVDTATFANSAYEKILNDEFFVNQPGSEPEDQSVSGFEDMNLNMSDAEISRFIRAFWRFELYCNLFRIQNLEDGSVQERILRADQKTLFFDHFAPYENEQLACIDDYFWDQISPAFDHIAQHDIEWSVQGLNGDGVHWKCDYVDEHRAANKEAILSRGCRKLDQIFHAKSYDERYRLLCGTQKGVPDTDNKFLYYDLDSDDDGDESARHDSYTLEQAKVMSKPPFVEEVDDGPLEAWKWANSTHHPDTYFVRFSKYFRMRALMMWDQSRFYNWSIFTYDQDETPSERLACLCFTS